MYSLFLVQYSILCCSCGLSLVRRPPIPNVPQHAELLGLFAGHVDAYTDISLLTRILYIVL